MGNNGATSADVARVAGVSKWTVIRAFTPGAVIAGDTRERVLRAARELDYRPNLLARSLATRTTHLVAVLIDDFANPYKLPTLGRLTAALQSHGKLAILVNINHEYDHVEAIVNARQRQLDSIVLFGTSFRDSMISDFAEARDRAPIYVLARECTLANIPYVTCDSRAAMADMCRHLGGRGYRRPAFLGGPKAISTAMGRHRAFVNYWRKRGLPIVADMEAPEYDRRIAEQIVTGYLATTQAEQRLDLLMCENDILAIGAIEALRKRKMKVPEDVAVAGFDDIDFAGTEAFDLTTYRQPYAEMVDVLVDMIVGRRTPENVRLNGALVIRGTA